MKKEKGFSLIEVLLGISIIGIALLSLAQLHTLCVMLNMRATQVSQATFLAQQQIDYLRTLTSSEMATLPVVIDEQVDINSDGTLDFRRITQIQSENSIYKILVFPATQLSTSQEDLIQNPYNHQVKAKLITVIDR